MHLIIRLEGKIDAVIQKAEQHEAYQLIFDPTTNKSLVVAIIRNILLQTHYYGPFITQALFTAIGRFPRTKPQLMRPVVEHVLLPFRKLTACTLLGQRG